MNTYKTDHDIQGVGPVVGDNEWSEVKWNEKYSEVKWSELGEVLVDKSAIKLILKVLDYIVTI